MLGLPEVLEEDLLVLGHAFQPNTCQFCLSAILDCSLNLRKKTSKKMNNFPLFSIRYKCHIHACTIAPPPPTAFLFSAYLLFFLLLMELAVSHSLLFILLLQQRDLHQPFCTLKVVHLKVCAISYNQLPINVSKPRC